MDFKFVPTNLIKAKEEVLAKHVGIGTAIQITTDFEIMNMIKNLASLRKEEVDKEALVLTKKNMEVITRYLPHNYYRIRMENLFLIFRLRCNLDLSLILFYEWQNAYDNQECNEFLRTFVQQNIYFEKIMKSNHFSIQKFQDVLSADNIAIAYGREAMALEDMQLKSLKEKLEYLGIREESRLSGTCDFLFYVFCMANDYLEAGEKKILITIRTYDDVIRKKFLQNFLGKLSLSELKEFKQLPEFFIRIIGENYSKEFNLYFKGFVDVLIRKYVDWINIYKINKIFGNDERSEFWEQYHYKLVTKYTYSDSVVMEFDKYVAVEFLGKSMGPLYIYKKEYFYKYVSHVFQNKIYDNMALRRYLLNNTEYIKNTKTLRSEKGTRLVHLPNPGWQSNFQEVLFRNQITERIL